MKSVLGGCLAGIVVVSSAASVSANEFGPALQELAEARIQAMVNDPAIVAAIQAQNEKHAGMDAVVHRCTL